MRRSLKSLQSNDSAGSGGSGHQEETVAESPKNGEVVSSGSAKSSKALLAAASNTSNGHIPQDTEKKQPKQALWGRAWKVDWLTYFGCLFVILVCPFLPAFFVLSCTKHKCSILETLQTPTTPEDMVTIISSSSCQIASYYIGWICFQIVLFNLPDILHHLPFYKGGLQNGAVTPAGNVNTYSINGLQAWIITHLLWYLNAYHLHWFSPSIISINAASFLLLANVFGYTLATFCYVKGHLFPTNPDDCKFSGSILYDFLMGIEFNPRIGKYFDFKLFFNGRPGIVCWTLINLSFAWHQKEKFGFVSDSMILLNILQAVYVLDFFWNETWYLKTIDICHDHFGWYLAWGDLVWLPFTYTLQAHYLSYHPVHLGHFRFIGILALGLLGYYIFRQTNLQKDRFRASPEHYKVWGKKATYITCTYVSGDGEKHTSMLLTSGWWGLARHMNYTGDLLGSLAYCLSCGSEHILPYFYIIYMSILLLHRIHRDEHRCISKYGDGWKEYVKAVPYRLLPRIY